MKKSAFLDCGGFNKHYLCLEDWEFAIRFSKSHKIGFVDEDLVNARISNNGVSSRIAEYYEARCMMVRDNLQGLLDNNIFNLVIEDILTRANNRGVLNQVQRMLELALQ